MKIIEKTTTPDGIEIQLEDWRDHNTEEYPNLYGYTIGAYPVAKNSDRWNFIRKGEQFRLTISHNMHKGYTNAMVLADFEKLKIGDIKLEDLKERYWDGLRDEFFMGLIDEKSVVGIADPTNELQPQSIQ